MSRMFNFSAGPAMLPEAVLAKAQREMLDWQDSGMSVMEMSHRGKQFMSIAAKAESDLRQLMAIPDNYKVLFLQGGASSQFAMVPLNLATKNKKADYFNTGAWSKKAIAEARRYCDVNVVWTGGQDNFSKAFCLLQKRHLFLASFAGHMSVESKHRFRKLDEADDGPDTRESFLTGEGTMASTEEQHSASCLNGCCAGCCCVCDVFFLCGFN